VMTSLDLADAVTSLAHIRTGFEDSEGSHLVLANESSVYVVAYDAEALQLVDVTEHFGIYSLEPVVANGKAQLLFGASFFQGWGGFSGVGFMSWQNDMWLTLAHEFERDDVAITPPAAGDIAGDGREDIIVALSSGELELTCGTDNGFELCGRFAVEHRPEAVAILRGDSARVVYTSEDGTWFAPIASASSCI
jgi:hypothetical protein